ncbi:hypothetical protein KBZ21_36080, partial [Streptomyces sp. A73]|nr:hypothetical protein [Streptomyces sp. A73]
MPDGRRLICDYKTGRSGIWGETALQLAAYARAEVYLDEHGIEQPIPHEDGGLAVWLRADGYDTYLVEDLDGAFQV